MICPVTVRLAELERSGACTNDLSSESLCVRLAELERSGACTNDLSCDSVCAFRGTGTEGRLVEGTGVQLGVYMTV